MVYSRENQCFGTFASPSQKPCQTISPKTMSAQAQRVKTCFFPGKTHVFELLPAPAKNHVTKTMSSQAKNMLPCQAQPKTMSARAWGQDCRLQTPRQRLHCGPVTATATAKPMPLPNLFVFFCKTCASIYLCIDGSIYLSIYLSVYLSIYLSISLSLSLSESI